MKTHKLPSGAVVALTLAPQGGFLPAAVIVHGWRSDVFDPKGSYEKAREVLGKAEYHCISISLRGHNGAEGNIGTVTPNEHLTDIKEAFGWLLHECPEVDTSSLGAFGTSYGAYLLSVLAPELPIKLLALRAPALYPDEGLDRKQARMVEDLELREWRGRVHLPGENRALQGIASFKKPILFVPSGKDEQIPAPVMESYAHAARANKKALIVPLPEATHRLMPMDMPKFLDILGSWFESHGHQTPVSS